MRLILIGLLALAVTSTSGCSGKPEWKRAYSKCKKKMEAQTAKMESDMAQKGDQFGMGSAMTEMMKGMTEGLCGMIKDACEKDPKGKACQEILKASKNM